MGDRVEATVERIAYGGHGVARSDGLAIFIPLSAPGDRLRVRITEVKKSYARAAIEQIITPSPLRREPPCQYFGQCGGCQLQHISYEAQLEAKSSFVRDALARIGRIDWPREIPVHSRSEFGYRSRAQIKLEQARPGEPGSRLKIGFNRSASHSVCDVESCPILVPELNAALDLMRSTLTDSPIVPEVELAAGSSGVAFEPEIEGLTGGVVTRSVRGALYSFSPTTFFQGNSLLLETLVDEAVGEERGDLAIDLYAGVGLFTVQLARMYSRVIGVESDRRAAGFARQNISAGGAANAEFYNTRVEDWLKDSAAQRAAARLPEIDLMLLDPPRAGAGSAIDLMAALKPRRITYVSCDPTTMARDLGRLTDAGYGMTDVVAFDLFPQTFHVETVAKLNRIQDRWSGRTYRRDFDYLPVTD